MSRSIKYTVRFLGVFVILYFGTLAVIGVAAPGGTFHSNFVAQYLDYVSWIRISLMRAAAFLLGIFGIATSEEPGFVLRMNGGKGVLIAYSCAGYGVYSFWVAYVVANRGGLRKKIMWTVAGVLGLWLINTIRISLFLFAINEGRAMPLGLDHHTWFNIFAYLLIFSMIIFYDRSLRPGIHDRGRPFKPSLKREGRR